MRLTPLALSPLLLFYAAVAMLRQSAGQVLLQLGRSSCLLLNKKQALELVGSQAQQFRGIGGDKIPEFWGRPSAYTEGTAFLGTPQNHLQLIEKRPLSPDVIEIDGKSAHYKFPLGAISSITNRATGVALSVGFIGAGYTSLTGSLPGLVAYFAATHPIVLFPFKFAIAYTIFYHYVGAIRHFVWDHHKIGNQADKTSLLEVPRVELLSKGIFVAAGVLALIAAFL